jgi:hypothetical protein
MHAKTMVGAFCFVAMFGSVVLADPPAGVPKARIGVADDSVRPVLPKAEPPVRR